MDFGSRFLLETIPLEEIGGKILDMGCGYGVFGIVISKVTGSNVDMADVNLRALHLAERNAKENGVSDKVNIFFSNVYENVSSKYSSIITNPPIRAGKKVVYDIVMNAKSYILLKLKKKEMQLNLLKKYNYIKLFVIKEKYFML